MFFALFLFISVVSIATGYNLISCVDPDTPLGSWKSSVPGRVGQINASKSYLFDGPNSQSAQEFGITFEGQLARIPNHRVYLYLSYLNDSPRRLIVQYVLNEKGSDFSLLPGANDAALEWGEAIEEIDVGKGQKPSITGLFKKPNQVAVRKLVIFSIRLNSGETVAGVASQLRSSSCAQLGKVVATASPTTRPIPMATSQKTPAPACPPSTVTASKSTSTVASGDACLTCPECKCVCNCNCKDTCQ